MRFSRPWMLASITLVLAAALPAACSATHDGAASAQAGSGGSGNAGTGGGSQGQGGDTFLDAGNDPVVSVVITPANPTAEVLNDVIPAAIPFVATGKTQGGAMVPVTGAWSY